MTIPKSLWKELGWMMLLSVAIYAVLFGILWLTEYTHPELQGVLLQWDNLSWVVGIPASVLGTAYVLTIRNPKNYTGFYLGIAMSLLLAWQFALQGSWDLVVLYVAVFVPFLIRTIVQWSRSADGALPTFLSLRQWLLTTVAVVVIVVGDYLFAHSWWSAMMIASSILANFWMIYKKVESWYFWLLYALSGIVLFVVLGNLFSVVLFVVMLLVNLSGLIAWLKAIGKRQ